MRYSALTLVTSFAILLATLSLWPENSRFGAPDRAVAKLPQEGGFGSQVVGSDPFGGGMLVPQEHDNHKASLPSRNTMNRRTVLQWLKSRDFSVHAGDSQLGGDGVTWNQLFEFLPQIEGWDFSIHVDRSAKDESNFDVDSVIEYRFGRDSVFQEMMLALAQVDCTFVVQGNSIVIISDNRAYQHEYCQRQVINCVAMLKQIELAEQHRMGLPVSHWSHYQHWAPRAAGVGGDLGGAAVGGGIGGMGGGGSGLNRGGGLFSVAAQQDPVPTQAKDQPQISLGVADDRQSGSGIGVGGAVGGGGVAGPSNQLMPGQGAGSGRSSGGQPSPGMTNAGAFGSGGMGGGMGAGLAGGIAGGGIQPMNHAHATVTPEFVLREMITRTVQPDFWAEGSGSIEFVGGMLVVVAPEKILYQVESLVEDLAAAFDGNF